MTAAVGLPVTVKRFISRDMHSLKGWLNTTDASLLALVDGWQRADGVRGDLCEIGVYHGRGMVLFGLLLQPGETAFGVDLFDSPDVHSWGRGDKDLARAALARFCNGARCELVIKSSLQLTAEDLLGKASMTTGIRLFSIDGGHEREIVEHDYRFAEKVLAPGGVVVVDDFFNRRWPGVSEAVNAVFAAKESALRPFAIGQAKVFFAQDEFADRYRFALERDWHSELDGPKVLFGSPVAVTRSPSRWQRVRLEMGAIGRRLSPRHLIERAGRALPAGRLLWAAGATIHAGDAAIPIVL